MENVYTAEGLMRALQLYSIAKQIIDACHAQAATYEMCRVILVTQMKCSYGAASDHIDTWESTTNKKFER